MTDGPALHITGLRKVYRSVTWRGVAVRHALEDLHLTVEPGEVHGLLGPNGAGKTTTLRVVTGWSKADGGSVSVFGHSVPEQLASVAPLVGAVIESPRFPGTLTPDRYLALLADMAGCPAGYRDEVLELVSLVDRRRDRIRELSLGMRQRLGIAAAMLRKPRLLLLDEPMNGLDPAGMRDMRVLLAELAANGAAVVLSTHLLAEVQQLCHRVTVVRQGVTVAEGPPAELCAAAGAELDSLEDLFIALTSDTP